MLEKGPVSVLLLYVCLCVCFHLEINNQEQSSGKEEWFQESRRAPRTSKAFPLLWDAHSFMG